MFICLAEIFIFLRLNKGRSFPYMLVNAFLVFLFLLAVTFNRLYLGMGEPPLIFLRLELLLMQVILVGYIFLLGDRSYLGQRLFSISGLVISGLIFLVTLTLPANLLFGVLSSGGKVVEEFQGLNFPERPGLTLWRLFSNFSVLVFIPSSVYMAARKSQPELKKYLWAVYLSVALILLGALGDNLAEAGIIHFRNLLPYFIFLYLIVQYVVQLDAYMADYSEKRNKFIENERFKNTLNQANVIIVFLNRMGHIDYINPYFLKITGFDERDVLGKDWFEFFLPPKDFYEVQSAFIEILEFDFHPRYSNPVIAKDGREIPVDWYNVRLKDANGIIFGSLSIGIDRPPKEA